MWPLWLCWALRGLLLASPGAALTERQVLGSLLQQLGLRRAPALGRAEVAGLAIPAPVRAQYVALLRQSHGDRSRGKRFSQHFREVAGRLLVSEASSLVLAFGLEQQLPAHRELVQAVLRLFQQPVPRAAGRRPERSARAQVSVEWLRVRDDGSNRTWLVDSRLVSVHDSGWKAFDVTEAVTFWQQLSRPRPPLLLQVSVRREPLGPGAAGAHRLVRFGAPGPAGAAQAAPQLELHTLDLRDYGAQGNCQPEAEAREAEGARCCRRETYLDLQGLRWAENWVLEPPGLLVYECVGRCRQPPEPLALRWPFLGPRQCVASETAALPVIVSAREGGRARPQVVSLPGLRVQRCGCASDGAPVPRRLQP
ncbi:left-right determination factor 2-like isoform X1 [Perognathus longimembris pacificus]|uniref:left-right determination factor 2-like isoform X1 n=1 Tax=Perognathus longimembris pacificus TaxID=214514 RepID=UPI002019EEC2|nr:left-right determination factor 2-like isoform X1 [Perognathus longimembris pacificus]